MTGWVSFFAGFSAPIAGRRWLFAEYLGHFFPALRRGERPCVRGLGRLDPAFGKSADGRLRAGAGLHGAESVGVQRVARVQNVLTGAKILVLLASSGSDSPSGTEAGRIFR